MQYISTRGNAPRLDFKGAMLAGLAADGGLYVPETVPQFSLRELARLRSCDYPTLAYAIIAPYVGDTFSARALQRMIGAAYANFRHSAIAPLTQRAHGQYVLELFHGPSLSFKDFALQLLGQMLHSILREEKRQAVVLGATSGDTGSAAISACMGAKHMDVVILYPKGRTSDIQRKQMTTTGAKNVHALAVNGTFDDCQALVKTLFADASMRHEVNLLAVNSINWARVMAQIVYYFYAALALGAPAQRVHFCVPTGNFGDIFAGHMAKQMGLPLGKLIIASNSNDILTRCYKTGRYAVKNVHATVSPSMDIQVSSNFERLLFDLHERNAASVRTAMERFAKTQTLRLSPAAHADFKAQFLAASIDDKTTLAQIKQTYLQSGILLDPHTAVGVGVAENAQLDGSVVTLATAHPAKFPAAVKKATGIAPALPRHLAAIHTRKESIIPMANNAATLKRFIVNL